MAPRRVSPSTAIRARDGALVRLRALNRLAVAGSVALVLGFTALAAKATPPRHPATASRAAASAPAPAVRRYAPSDDRAARRPHRHHDDDTPAPRTAVAPAPRTAVAPAPAPQPTPQPPVVVSGGS